MNVQIVQEILTIQKEAAVLIAGIFFGSVFM